MTGLGKVIAEPTRTAVRGALRERWRAAALHLVQESPGPQGMEHLARLLRDDPLDVQALTLLAELDWSADNEAWRRLCRTLAQHHQRRRRSRTRDGIEHHVERLLRRETCDGHDQRHVLRHS